MNQIFSEAWMKALKEQWNATPEVYEPLKKVEFTARIGYGLKGEARARGLLMVVNGMVMQAGAMDADDLDWDLRATPEDWNKWIEHGFGLTRLGPAIATNALEFASGNYRQMIANQSLSKAFLHHFSLMSEI